MTLSLPTLCLHALVVGIKSGVRVPTPHPKKKDLGDTPRPPSRGSASLYSPCFSISRGTDMTLSLPTLCLHVLVVGIKSGVRVPTPQPKKKDLGDTPRPRQEAPPLCTHRVLASRKAEILRC